MDKSEEMESCSLNEDSSNPVNSVTNEIHLKMANCDIDMCAEELDFEDDDDRAINLAAQKTETGSCGLTECLGNSELYYKVEEGEIVDDVSVEDGEIESKIECNFIQRDICHSHYHGRCVWGEECHSMHLSDKGLYSMLDSPFVSKFIYQQTSFWNKNDVLYPYLPACHSCKPAEGMGDVQDETLMKVKKHLLGEKEKEPFYITVADGDVFVNKKKYSRDPSSPVIYVSKRQSRNFGTRCSDSSEVKHEDKNGNFKCNLEWGEDPWMTDQTLSCRKLHNPQATSDSFGLRVGSWLFRNRSSRCKRGQSECRSKPNSSASTHRSDSSSSKRISRRVEKELISPCKREISLKTRYRRRSLNTCNFRGDLDNARESLSKSVCYVHNHGVKSLGRTSRLHKKFESLSDESCNDASTSSAPDSFLKMKHREAESRSRSEHVLKCSKRRNYVHLRSNGGDVLFSVENCRSPEANFHRQVVGRATDLESEDPFPKQVSLETSDRNSEHFMKNGCEDRLSKTKILSRRKIGTHRGSYCQEKRVAW